VLITPGRKLNRLACLLFGRFFFREDPDFTLEKKVVEVGEEDGFEVGVLVRVEKNFVKHLLKILKALFFFIKVEDLAFLGQTRETKVFELFSEHGVKSF